MFHQVFTSIFQSSPTPRNIHIFGEKKRSGEEICPDKAQKKISLQKFPIVRTVAAECENVHMRM